MSNEDKAKSRDRKESEAKRATQAQDTIFRKPQIIRQPMSQTVRAGERIRITVQASGVPIPRFRWRANGAVLEGVSSNVLVIPNARQSHSGLYIAEAYNVVGAEMSRGASIQVLKAEEEVVPISVQIVPSHIEVSPGKEFVFVAELSNYKEGKVHYQWFKDGKKIKGANASTLRIIHAKEKYVGSYIVVVQSDSARAQSEAASLVLRPEPSLHEAPEPLAPPPLEPPVIELEESTRTRDTAGFMNFPLDRERQRLERKRDFLVSLLGTLSRVLPKAG